MVAPAFRTYAVAETADPVIFANVMELILTTLPDAAAFVTSVTADVVAMRELVLPYIDVTSTMFGAATDVVPYPNTIAMAMALPVVAILVSAPDVPLL